MGVGTPADIMQTTGIITSLQFLLFVSRPFIVLIFLIWRITSFGIDSASLGTKQTNKQRVKFVRTIFPNVCSTEKHTGIIFFYPKKLLPTELKTKQNKMAIDIARNLLQYCQLPNKNSRRTLVGICNFFGMSKFLYCLHNFHRNPY